VHCMQTMKASELEKSSDVLEYLIRLLALRSDRIELVHDSFVMEVIQVIQTQGARLQRCLAIDEISDDRSDNRP
jgi:hypothetical protein